MNNIRINKYLYIILLCVLFIGARVGHASETFQNNLLKMDFYQSSSGAIKVTLYTSKPYNDVINVNKKSDVEYIILMPETANSMTANPILNAVAGTVKAVIVKTQQYENNITGYTKITVATTKPIEIIPQVQTLKGSDYQLSENDYKELLAQTAKQTKIQPKTEGKKTLPVKKTTVYAGLHSKSDLNLKSRLGLTKGTAENTRRVTLSPKRREGLTQQQKVGYTSNASRHKSIQKPYLTQATRGKRNLYQSKPRSYKKNIVKPQIVEKPKHVETKPVETKSSIQQNVITPPTAETKVSAPVEEIKEQTPLQTQTVAQQPQIPTVQENPAPVQSVGKFQKYKNIIKNNLYAILGLIFAAFILLLLGARKKIKNTHKQKETFINHLDEMSPTVTDYTEKINEDMTWKEKFQTYKETAQEQSQIDETAKPKEETFQDIEELNELFGSEPMANVDVEQDFPKEETIIENEIPEVEEQQNEEESTLDELDEMQKYDVESENVSIEELFGDEEYLIEEAVGGAEEEGKGKGKKGKEEFEAEIKAEEPEEIVKSEFQIDDEKGFYLVDFENTTALVGHIEDEIFILKRFKEKVEGPLQARLNEKKPNSINYMTKIGDFKALVEVTPNNMNLLIEL